METKYFILITNSILQSIHDQLNNTLGSKVEILKTSPSRKIVMVRVTITPIYEHIITYIEE